MSELPFDNKDEEKVFQEIFEKVKISPSSDRRLTEIDLRRIFIAGERYAIRNLCLEES